MSKEAVPEIANGNLLRQFQEVIAIAHRIESTQTPAQVQSARG